MEAFYQSSLDEPRGTADLFSALVNLDSNSVEATEKLDPHFHGQADVDEIIEMRDVCLQHPKVLEEVKRFKLPDDLELVGDTWPYGRDSEDTHPRYVQVSVSKQSRLEDFRLTRRSVTFLLGRIILGLTIMILLCRSPQSLT